MRRNGINTVGALMATAAQAGPNFVNLSTPKKEVVPKNKYNLNPYEVTALSVMTPKEKKKFLKERNKG